MEISRYLAVAKAINLLLAALTALLLLLAGITVFTKLWVSIVASLLLVVNSVFLLRFHKQNKYRPAAVSFALNLLLLFCLPFYRFFGTGLREGYLELLLVSAPLLLLMAWYLSLQNHIGAK